MDFEDGTQLVRLPRTLFPEEVVMTRRSTFRSLAAAVGVLAIAGACGGGGGGGQSEALAADQTFRFALTNDVTSLDPAHVDSAVDITFITEVFTGLYRFDNALKIVPSGATALPDVSADGMTYTFHLRKDMVFSNGDKITAADWIYSWTRTLRLDDAYAGNLEVINGAGDVESGAATKLAGLSAPDDYTLKAQLSAPAGYWLTQLAMPTASEVLDQKVIRAAGDDRWTEQVSTYIGSGPFKMTSRVPKQSMDFEAVKNWWGGDTGKLTKIHVDIGVDLVSAVKKFESGGYENVGMANQPAGPDDVLRYKNDPTKSKLLNIYNGARTTGIGFNFITGPFASKPGTKPGDSTVNPTDPGKDGRIAFSIAIDRAQLADIACAHAITCQPATGGPITKGFKGYLGDNADPYAKFDANAAKALYQKWDPDGSKVRGLEYRYNSNPGNDKIAQNLQAQWKQNLGIDVKLVPSDFPTLQRDRKKKIVTIGRESWGIDYDHPQDWFDNLYSCAQAPIGRGNDEAYCNPAMDAITQAANAKPVDQAVPDYVKAQKMLVDDVVWATLFYGTQPYMTQTYVKGAGYNGLYDFNWEGIRILQH
jgi:oligopeptide transport system substrate-binding protein